MATSSFDEDFTLTKKSAKLLLERINNPEPSPYKITQKSIDEVDEMIKNGRALIKIVSFAK